MAVWCACTSTLRGSVAYSDAEAREKGEPTHRVPRHSDLCRYETKAIRYHKILIQPKPILPPFPSHSLQRRSISSSLRPAGWARAARRRGRFCARGAAAAAASASGRASTPASFCSPFSTTTATTATTAMSCSSQRATPARPRSKPTRATRASASWTPRAGASAPPPSTPSSARTTERVPSVS